MAAYRKAPTATNDGRVSLPEQGRVASHAQVSAKIRALHAVLGPCIVRFDDGRQAVLSAEALKIVPFHGGTNA